MIQRLCDQLNDTTGLLDLLLGIAAEVAGTDDEGDLGETALAEDLGVAQGQEVDDGGSVGLLAAQVGLTLLGGDESPQLYRRRKKSVSETVQNMPVSTMPVHFVVLPSECRSQFSMIFLSWLSFPSTT